MRISIDIDFDEFKDVMLRNIDKSFDGKKEKNAFIGMVESLGGLERHVMRLDSLDKERRETLLAKLGATLILQYMDMADAVANER